LYKIKGDKTTMATSSSNYYSLKTRRPRTRRASYELASDICAICGQSGGKHYSSDGISWCYPFSTRKKSDNPKYHTTFTYSKISNNNPNKTFRKRV